MKNSQKYMTAPENRQFFAFPDFCGGGGGKMQVLCGTMNGKVTAKLNKVLLDMIKHPHTICNKHPILLKISYSACKC